MWGGPCVGHVNFWPLPPRRCEDVDVRVVALSEVAHARQHKLVCMCGSGSGGVACKTWCCSECGQTSPPHPVAPTPQQLWLVALVLRTTNATQSNTKPDNTSNNQGCVSTMVLLVRTGTREASGRVKSPPTPRGGRPPRQSGSDAGRGAARARCATLQVRRPSAGRCELRRPAAIPFGPRAPLRLRSTSVLPRSCTDGEAAGGRNREVSKYVPQYVGTHVSAASKCG